MNKSVLTFASGNYYVLRSMSIGPDFCYNVCRDLLTCRAPSKGAVCYTRSAAALPHSRLKGVTHIGRHFCKLALHIAVSRSVLSHTVFPHRRTPRSA